jgi:hypothetical protein
MTILVILALASMTTMFLTSGMMAISSGIMGLFWMLAALIQQLRDNHRDLMVALEAGPDGLRRDVDA